ncbi:hypothetical protein BCR42DRAFT_430472 [Absidia repens]|uniref:Uncharacterized protein n=1 Tax=Absidia repens TaxID=90262 RepID=A0A1X2HFA2_9FUNG|nr:hypothetical protein BCR42DRAFT_430472 [Absidia repens]
MALAPEYQEYRLPQPANDSLVFFHEHPASAWGFEQYLLLTHQEFSKTNKSNVKAILNDYYHDLQDILRLQDIPKEISDHVTSLLKKRYTDSQIKKDFCSKAKSTWDQHRPLIIRGNNIGTLNNAEKIINNYYATDAEASGKRKRENADNDDDVDVDVNSADDFKNDNVWEACLGFIQSDHGKKFHKHSPAKHGIIQCGFGISRRPNWPEDIYLRLLKSHIMPRYPIPEECVKYINGVIDSKSIYDYKKAISKKDPAFEENTELDKAADFIEDLFTSAYHMYNVKQDVNHSESVFNYIFVYPFLRAVAAAINEDMCDFVPGETYLKAMTKQLESVGKHLDDRFQYKADGVFRLFNDRKQLEIMLLETSNAFECRDKGKISFDHHKGVFGTVAMLKTIADYYSYATTDQFAKIKVFFIQAAGDQLHLWSLCYKENGIYDLWRETYLTIRPSFDDRADLLQELLQFFWNMKELINESIQNIAHIRQNHISNRTSSRYKKRSPPLLTEIINPPIIKLMQNEDIKGMADLGPFYSPHESPAQSPAASPNEEN